MKKLSQQTEDHIVYLLHQPDLSIRKISNQTGVSIGKISSIRNKRCPELPKASGGRPSILSDHENRLLLRSITSGKADTAPQAKRILGDITNKSVSTSTIRRSLKSSGFVARVKVKKPLRTRRHRLNRLHWAESHAQWTVDDWKKVLWSDETKINRLGSDGRQWVWGRKGEPLNDRRVKTTVKFGGGSVIAWGCMGWNGVGRIVKIDGKMDAQLYCEILEDDLLGSMEELGLDRGGTIFQQDNDPKHTSKMAKKWFKNSQIQVMSWPAQSPDLNPIEHLWHHVKCKLADFNDPPTSVDALWNRIQDVWSEIDPEVCQNLIRSMPRRVEAVVKARGGHTKY